MKLSKNFYDFDIDLKSNKSKLVGTAEYKNEKYYIRLLSSDGKSSIRREIGVCAAIDLAKKLIETFNFRCKKCHKLLSLEKGEIHHGCLSCF